MESVEKSKIFTPVGPKPEFNLGFKEWQIYGSPDKLNATLSDLMEQSMNDEEIKTNESILHHKENIDLIPSSLNLLALETSLAYVIKTISRTVTV